MASTYTTSLKIQQIGSGEQSGIWGTTTNTNWTLIEQAIAGVQTITMANADYTLTNLNGVSDEARNMVLVVNGTNSAIRKVVAPLNQPKLYVVSNQTTGGYAITIGSSTGLYVTIPNGVTAQVYTDGTNFYSAQTGSAGDFNINGNATVSGALSVTGNSTVSGNAAVSGNSNVAGNGTVGGDLTVTGSITAGSVTGVTGRIVQIVSNKYTNSTQTTSTSYVDTFNTLTITPTSTSSKIVLFAESLVAVFNYAGYAGVRMIRNTSANVIVGDHLLWASNGFTAAPFQTYSGIMLHCVDQPNTTSAVTYKVQLKAYSSGSAVTAVYGMYDTDGVVFTAMEVL